MHLIEKISIYKKFLYKLMGIVSFSESKFNHLLWVSPYYFILVYTTYKFYIIILSDRKFGILSMIDYYMFGATTIALLVSWLSFLMRKNKIEILLKDLQMMEFILPRQDKTNSCDYFSYLALFLFFAYSFLTPFLDVPFEISAYYSCPGFMLFCDQLFLNDILGDIYVKLKIINKQIKLYISRDEIKFNMKPIENLIANQDELIILTKQIFCNFEITIISTMLHWFCTVIGSAYWFLYSAKRLEETLYLHGYYLLYLCHCFVWLVMMLAMFPKIENQVNKTSFYIHQIWNKFASYGKLNKDVKALQMISVKLFNNKLRFTARDFFYLDWSFCYLMIAAVSTYVIIFVQFEF